MNVNDLPDEMLCTIFDYLDLYELKVASLVCLRWCELTFSGRRMDRVVLAPQCDNPNDFLIDDLQSSKRSYRNVCLSVEFPVDQLESLIRFLHTIKLHVRMLDIYCAVTWDQLGSILSEAPKLQNLSIHKTFLQEHGKNNTPLRVLPELKSLNRRQLLSFLRTNIPNLQSLAMECSTHLELEVWKYFSGQLKLVDVQFPFSFATSILELTFPLVEDLTFFALTWDCYDKFQKLSSSLGDDFFRRHPLLRRLSMYMPFPVKWVESITRHCPELTYLHLTLDKEATDLESLVQLTKLKFLSLEDDSVRFDRLEHLQELRLSGDINIRSIHRNNVRRLTMYDAEIPNDELDQIPKKFPSLKSLMFQYCSVSVADVEKLHKLMPSCKIDYDFGNKCFYPIDNVSAD